MQGWVERHWKLLAACFTAAGSVIQMTLPNNMYILSVGIFCGLIAVYLVLDGLRQFKISVTPISGSLPRYFDNIGEFWIKTIFLVCLLSLIIGTIVAVRIAYQPPEPPVALLYFKQWNVERPHDFHAVVNTRPLVNFKKTSRLMLTCLWPDFTVDYLDNSKIQKSGLFEITGDDIGMQLALSEEFVKSHHRPTFIQCFLCLLPRSMTPNDVQNMRQLVDAGGVVLQPAGLSMGTQVTDDRPIPSIPSQPSLR